MVDRQEITAAWRALGRQLAALRKAAGYTQHTFAPVTMYGRSTIANVEVGHQQQDRRFWALCDQALKAGGILIEGYDRVVALEQRHRRQQALRTPDPHFPSAGRRLPATQTGSEHGPESVDVEEICQSFDEAVGHSDVPQSSLDDWELTVAEHGRATRYRASGALLRDLAADMSDLRRLLRERRHTASSLRRTTLIAAQMAGLMSLTLLKLNATAGSRRWGRTARAAAAEAADPATSSWVWAQEAYRHFYTGGFAEAIAVARHAQDLASGVACTGTALAAALEARAHASTGNATQTRAALHRASDDLARLDPEMVTASAFGYDEAQLRFHEGNAWTHLGNSPAAWTAHERALQLYPPSDYLDRSLIHLDRAACAARSGDGRSAAQQIIAVMTGLAPQQRSGLLQARAREVYHDIPAAQRTLAPVREVDDLLALCVTRDKEPPP